MTIARVALRGDHLTRLMVATTFCTGVVDGGTYLDLHRVFVANMTGNVIFIALGASGYSGFPLVRAGIALAGFAAGAAVGGVVLRHAASTVAARRAAKVLALTAALLVAVAVLSAGVRYSGAGLDVLGGVLAATMGAQASATRSLGVLDVPTVVVTSTLASLAADPWFGAQRSPRTARRAAAVGAMLAGGFAGAGLARLGLWAPLLLSGLGLAFVAAVLVFGWPLRRP